ncbi:MAG TPA: O-antigen ligase family protein [Thermomicrobiales bacterium]
MSLHRYRQVCVVAAVAIFFSNFANYAERWGLIPLYWVAFIGMLTAPLLLVAATESRLQVRPLLLWGAGYLLMSIAWYFPSRQDDIAYQEVQTRVLSVIFLALMLFLFAGPAEQRLARQTIALVQLVAIGLNIYELFNPLTFSKIPGRSSGLFENSNPCGAALVLGLILSYGVVPSRLRLPFVLATGVGIVTTFSRSAMLGWVLVSGNLAFRSGLSIQRLRAVAAAGVLIVGFIFSPWWRQLEQKLEQRGALNLDLIQRLAFFTTGRASDDSANERYSVLVKGWELFTNHPFIGNGTGAARDLPGFDVSTHNIYVYLLVDHGILGLAIMAGLLVATLWGAGRATAEVAWPFGLFLAVWGMFSHNVLEERYILLAVALVASMVASARHARAEAPEKQAARIPAEAMVTA